ncbi:MAG TPA: hypothetical protein VGB24_11340 [Longimicrobium sp.]|jgi:hypothetical protein|uniref:hypothetical protein n=1 Tax=Longimicrobium sp. TaxID=2029185 RepID=UPI002ED9D33F
MRRITLFSSAVILLALAACSDEKLPTVADPDSDRPKPPPTAVGLYEFEVSGISGGEMTSALLPAGRGPAAAVIPAGSGIVFEAIGSTSLVEGTRTNGGHRYISFTYRVRNSTGAPLTNLTMLLVERPGTVAGTPLSTLRRFDGTAANPAIAAQVVPTGAVALGSDLVSMQGLYPDVLQVLTEGEVAAITKPADVTNIFPVGYVVRSALTNANRTLAHTTDPNQFGGILTLSFRVPLQATSSADVFSFIFQVLAVTDTETRLTESIEEARDTAAVRRLRERATALGATTVTVLNGSPAADPFVTDYPGQRQLCSVRTAGTAASPVTAITAPSAYARIAVYRPGETLDACAANFTGGTALPANFGMPYPMTLRAMDRYGNVRTGAADTVRLASTDGTATMPAPTPLVSGAGIASPVYMTYGGSTLSATGRRLNATSPVSVMGMMRNWTGSVDTNWFTNGDWAQNFYPGVQDSVTIPGDRPNYPVLAQNITVAGLTLVDGSTVQPFINISSFDLTINSSLAMGNNGQILGTGRVILAGTSGTISGGVSNVNMRNVRVTGSYTADSNVNVTGGRIVVQGGRLRTTGKRIRVRPS